MTRATTHQMGVDTGSPMMWTGRIHQDRQHGQTRQPCGHHTVMSSLDDEIAVVRPAAAAAAGSPAASRRVDTGWPEELVLGPAPRTRRHLAGCSHSRDRCLANHPIGTDYAPAPDAQWPCHMFALLPQLQPRSHARCIRETSTFRPCHTRPSSSAAGRPDRT